MQPGSIAFSSPSPHHPYHVPYHTHLPAQQDHELKKQYLTLLPPQQIIEICLTFDIHVPPYVKSTIWPPDINAAIATLQKTSSPTAEPSTTEASVSNGPPAMGSLGEGLDASSSPGNLAKPDKPQPPDRSTPTPGPSIQLQSVPKEQPGAQVSQPHPPHPPPYPHQPYGYPHPQSAYPHTPYYQHSSLGYPYSPYQMPGYPHPPHPGFPQPPLNPLFTNSPQQPPQPADNFNQHTSTDDLPSYEEMIAEALQDSEDVEGCAPKDLFNWMASRYPLQQNFRPSASQALQKAFKRGRFQKGSNGKYRINATWEGGNTSRRTTRRPQTQATSTSSGPSTASPFTHAPLVHHQQTTPTPQNAPNHHFQGSYVFPYGQPGYPGFPQHQLQQPPIPTAPAAEASDRSSHNEGDAADAYEAAQNILKAINFGGLLEFPEEDETTKKSIIPQVTTTEVPTGSIFHPTPTNVTIDVDSSVGHTLETNRVGVGINTLQVSSGNPRAELQAQLALLAAQLAELVQTDEEDPPPAHQPNQPSSEPSLIFTKDSQSMTAAPSVPDPPLPVSKPLPPVIGHPHTEQEEEEDSDDDDMEEVI
ncbi:hypothetical protein BDZ94DRAFT_1187600 [Collybia nuda]|uniref:Histone H1 n=1 Tax=Collybia nuda TaxID=64659 RepID=A0A9P5YCQ3_9AGAR|nr:hypothetical protein BDZ94DRAFT_1187600 [Collybia nuda]